MKLAILSATISAACAFAPSAPVNSASSLQMYVDPAAETPVKSNVAVAPIHGWVPDESLPLFGLPGTGPTGFFDPVGFTRNLALPGAKRFREAEVMHGRVAMMASLGYIIGESTPTITYGTDVHHTIANNQLSEVSWTILFPFFLAINFSEAVRATKGWIEPGAGPLFTLRENYYPGDIGFDPLNLSPKDPVKFAEMQTKEINNGRLAMFAAAGMCVQEQINGKGILENLFA